MLRWFSEFCSLLGRSFRVVAKVSRRIFEFELRPA